MLFFIFFDILPQKNARFGSRISEKNLKNSPKNIRAQKFLQDGRFKDVSTAGPIAKEIFPFTSDDSRLISLPFPHSTMRSVRVRRAYSIKGVSGFRVRSVELLNGANKFSDCFSKNFISPGFR